MGLGGVLILLFFTFGTPANTQHFYNICKPSDQRLRRWAVVVQMLYKCFVFAGTGPASSAHNTRLTRQGLLALFLAGNAFCLSCAISISLSLCNSPASGGSTSGRRLRRWPDVDLALRRRFALTPIVIFFWQKLGVNFPTGGVTLFSVVQWGGDSHSVEPAHFYRGQLPVKALWIRIWPSFYSSNIKKLCSVAMGGKQQRLPYTILYYFLAT